MKIEIAPEVIDYFNELSTILYKNDYFGFEENAIKYVDELLNEIKHTPFSRVKKTCTYIF